MVDGYWVVYPTANGERDKLQLRVTEISNTMICIDSFNRLKISSRISFLAQAFELPTQRRSSSGVSLLAKQGTYHEQNGIQATDYDFLLCVLIGINWIERFSSLCYRKCKSS